MSEQLQCFILSCLTETGYIINKNYNLNFYGLLKKFLRLFINRWYI